MSQQNTTLVECKKIKFANGKKGLAQAVLDTLFDSISKEGMHQAVGLRPDPEKPGHYILIYGRHRFYVVSKLCKDEVIRAQVYDAMTPEEAELATLTENACRTNAKPHDRLLTLRRWQEVYKKQYPHLEGKKASGSSRWANSTKSEAKQAAIDAEKAADEVAATQAEDSSVQNAHYSSGSDNQSVQVAESLKVPSEPEEKPKKKKTPTYRERVKAITGMSEATITRDTKIIDNLDEDQVWVLDKVQCTKTGMTQIIDATDDKGKRGEIVNVVASGMEIEQAIANVLGTAATAAAAGTVKEVGDPTKKADAELTDEEWFLKECGSFSDLLSDNDQYRADAILYHQISEARGKFRKSIKKAVEDYKKGRQGKKVGWFFLSLYSVLNVSHPNDWQMCGTCGGRGVVDPGDECKACKGACYKTATERYA
jgi:ParB-like chromosome segregation protein Spo0J